MHPARKLLPVPTPPPEKQSNVLCAHGLPLLHIAVCMVHLWAAPIVVCKCPIQHRRIRKAICFQSPHKVEMLPFLNSCFLLFPFRFATGTFYGVSVLSHQDKTLGKEGIFWRMTLAAVEQTICPIIIHCVFGYTGNGLFQNLFNRLYRLSPSAKV